MAKKKKKTTRTKKPNRTPHHRYIDDPNPEEYLGSLSLAGHTIFVDRHDDLHAPDGTKCDGLYIHSLNQILLDTCLSPEAEREVFLHELFHAVADKYHLPYGRDEEEALANPTGCGFGQALAALLPPFPLKPW